VTNPDPEVRLKGRVIGTLLPSARPDLWIKIRHRMTPQCKYMKIFPFYPLDCPGVVKIIYFFEFLEVSFL
jgi:hypothetical protein